MPLIEIREVLVGELNQEIEGSDPVEYEQLQMCQKRLNLEHGYKYEVKNVQVFDDMGNVISSLDGEPKGIAQLTYVTPYPIVLNNEAYGVNTLQTAAFTQAGPFAADDSVLYKGLEISTNEGEIVYQNDKIIKNEFPNPELELLTPMVWYTPHLYLTLIQTTVGKAQKNKIAKSFYLELKKTRCSTLERSMGQYKEMLEAQARLITLTANMITPVGSAAGRSFPSWLFGGIRSEIMINSVNVLRYYNHVASRDYQKMMTQDAFRARFKQATRMVAFDEPFGTGNPENIPDWITVMNVAGVTSGPIRDYPPPVKYTGNGNTVMYDAAGLPASVVT